MKGKKGSITIEAALVLPIFVFLLVALTNFIKIMIVYDNIGGALNNSVKTINRYSYLAQATGLRDLSESINIDTKESMKSWVSVTGIFGGEDVDGLESAINNFDPNALSAESLQELFRGDDFYTASLNLIMVMLNNGLKGDHANGIDNLLSGGLKGFAESSIKTSILGTRDDSEFESVMKAYGIKATDGEYFDFDDTSVKLANKDGNDEISAVVSYKYAFKFMGKEIEIPITQRATVVPWVGVGAE